MPKRAGREGANRTMFDLLAVATQDAIRWEELGLRHGIDLGFFPENCRQPIDELFMETQPAHLQKGSQQKLAADERDAVRAQIIRERLAEFPKPDLSATAKEPDQNGGESEKS